MPTIRPLPDRPNLEHVRKEAKLLLRRLRAGNLAALERAHAMHDELRRRERAQFKLADAQLAIAREYGFSSWPRLVHYFHDVERQQHAPRQMHGGRGFAEAQARSLLAPSAQNSLWGGRMLAAYVPRFFGLGMEDVRAQPVSEEEARLAIARAHGAPSWTVLLERLEENERAHPGDWEVDPLLAAADAMRNLNVTELERIVAAHPGLLHPSPFERATGHNLMWVALGAERRMGRVAVQPIIDWLTARGFDRQRELNQRLCGRRLGCPPMSRHMQAISIPDNFDRPLETAILLRDTFVHGSHPHPAASPSNPVLHYWSTPQT